MYYIYEIPSERKVGVTDNVEKRIQQHVKRYGISPREFIILESYTDIHKVSDREIELQVEKGYPVDSKPYWYVRQVMQKKATTKEAQKKRVANIDWKALSKKRVANTDWKARSAKIDFKANSSHRQREIIAIDPDGNRTIYSGMEEAARQLTKLTGVKFYSAGISNVCNPKQKATTHRKYTFELA